MSLDNYVAPVFLTDQAKNLNDKFYLLLTNLVNSYSEAKLNPTVISTSDKTKTNLQVYNDTMSQMMKLQNDYFLYKNSIAKNSHDLITYVNSVDDKINVLDAENKLLTTQLGEMANSSYSAEGLLDDSQITRNQMFYGNIVLFVIMATGGYMYYQKVINNTN
jgi:hypothetical protein